MIKWIMNLFSNNILWLPNNSECLWLVQRMIKAGCTVKKRDCKKYQGSLSDNKAFTKWLNERYHSYGIDLTDPETEFHKLIVYLEANEKELEQNEKVTTK